MSSLGVDYDAAHTAAQVTPGHIGHLERYDSTRLPILQSYNPKLFLGTRPEARWKLPASVPLIMGFGTLA
jgi:hypothetical protein